MSKKTETKPAERDLFPVKANGRKMRQHPGPAGAARERATTAAEILAIDALRLYREGVPWHEAIITLNVGKTAYYDALARGKAAAREALADAADDLRAWETEQGMKAHKRLLADAEYAREMGNTSAAVSAERAASAQRERLAALWGIDAAVKTDLTLAAPDILSAVSASLSAQASVLLEIGNGETMGADDGED